VLTMFFKRECECDKIYKYGEEIWGYFDVSFPSLSGNLRCRKTRFEKFRVKGSEAILIDGKLKSVIYSTHFNDMAYDLSFIQLKDTFVDKDLQKLKLRVLEYSGLDNLKGETKCK